MDRKHLTYLTPEELKGERAREVRQVLESYHGDAAAIGLGVLERYLPTAGRDKLRALECGAASGWFCQELARNGFREIYAVDIDDYRDEAVKKADIIKEFKTLDLSFEKLPWPDGFFGFITAWCLLPHLENPHNFIREVHRVLARGGIFVLSMPHITSLLARKRFFKTGELERYTGRNNHISVFTRELFSKTVLRYFTLRSTEYLTDLEKIARGRFGWLKVQGLTREWFGRRKFEEWFGHNLIYILEKPSTANGR